MAVRIGSDGPARAADSAAEATISSKGPSDQLCFFRSREDGDNLTPAEARGALLLNYDTKPGAPARTESVDFKPQDAF